MAPFVRRKTIADPVKGNITVSFCYRGFVANLSQLLILLEQNLLMKGPKSPDFGPLKVLNMIIHLVSIPLQM
jgi:hypothetical protein